MSIVSIKGQHQRTLLTDDEWVSGPLDETRPLVESETFFDRIRSVAIRDAENKVVLEAPLREWFEPVLQRLRELVSMQADRDASDQRPVRAECVAGTLLVLEVLQETDFSIPELAPTSQGGIQALWHGGDMDVEIEIDGYSHFRYTIEEGESVQERETNSVCELRKSLLPILRRLAKKRHEDEELLAKSAEAARQTQFSIGQTEEIIRLFRREIHE